MNKTFILYTIHRHKIHERSVFSRSFLIWSSDFTVIMQTFNYLQDIQTGKLGRCGESMNLLFKAD